MKIYGKIKVHFGNLWAFASHISLMSMCDQEVKYVSSRMKRIEVFKEIIEQLDADEAQIEYVDEKYNTRGIKYGVRKHKKPYLRTKNIWKKKYHNRICYQLDTESKSWPDKILHNHEILVNNLKAIGFNMEPVGLPLTMEESIEVAANSDLFIGICSGMGHVCHSVGTPMMLYNWPRLAKCHPGKKYMTFESIHDCMNKVNKFMNYDLERRSQEAQYMEI